MDGSEVGFCSGLALFRGRGGQERMGWGQGQTRVQGGKMGRGISVLQPIKERAGVKDGWTPKDSEDGRVRETGA